jgi:hypothetical protein
VTRSGARTAIESQARVSSPGRALLLAAARLKPDVTRLEQLARSIVSRAEWECLLAEAQEHGCLPLLCSNLLALEGAIPAWVRDDLNQRLQEHTRKNLWLAQQLLEVTQLLAAHDIPCLSYKGLMLAQEVYGNLSLRQFCDLDILIADKDWARAKAVLVEAGYRPLLALNGAQEHAYLRSGWERQFASPDGALIEIQWRIAARFYSVGFDIPALLSTSHMVSLGGRQVASMSAEDMMLVLCFHGAKHVWARLSWVCDVAEMMRASQLDWQLVFERARSLGIVRMLSVGLLLANRLIDAPLPPQLIAGPGEAHWAEYFERNLLQSGSSTVAAPEGSLEYFFDIAQLRERWRDRFLIFLRLAFTPSLGEWSTIALPAALFPLYWVVRFFRLLGKLRQVGRGAHSVTNL